MFAAAHEAFTRSGRGAKQIHEKPRIAVEIANEVQIFVGTEIYTLSLHDALPIYCGQKLSGIEKL